MRRVATSWKVIEGVLEENQHSAYQALRPPATPEIIREVEALMSTRLPRPFVSSLRVHDGMLSTANFAGFYSLLSVTDIGKWWRIMEDNRDDVRGPRTIDGERIKGDLRWREAWVPIALEAGGNLIAMDLDPGPSGTVSQIFFWQNYGSPPPRVVASSYAEWLNLIAEELTHRRFDLDQWGGIHLRNGLA